MLKTLNVLRAKPRFLLNRPDMAMGTVIFLSFIVVVVIAVPLVSPPSGGKVVHVSGKWAVNAADPKALVGWADDVFFGKVIDSSGVVMYEESPRSLFKVNVELRLKGSVSGSITVAQLGGVDPQSGDLVIYEKDPLLQMGDRYLFVTRTASNLQWHTAVADFGTREVTSVEQSVVLENIFRDAVLNEVPHWAPNPVTSG